MRLTTEPTDVLLTLWHGAKRWEGPVEIQPCTTGNYEHGPGLYLTTSYDRARSYAKGGGSTVAITLCNPRFMDRQSVPLDEALAFIKGCPGLRQRAKIAEDLKTVAERRNDARVGVSNVITLAVNHKALAGDSGPALAAWVTAQGVDADIVKTQSNDNWVVVFNPAVVVAHRKVPASQVDVLTADHAPMSRQIEQEHQRIERHVLHAVAAQGLPERSPVARL